MTKQKMFVNPFSELFLEKWELWKEFKKESFNFQYKGVISEQMAINHLVDLSDGEEEKAEKIIEQSIRRQWQGFFPLKETTHGTKQSTSKKGSANCKPEPSLRDQAANEFMRRNGGGQQQADGSYLKAV